MHQLKPDFLIELAKSCIVSTEILEVIKPHLKFSFIDQAPLKHIFKYIFDYHSATKKSPTIGLLSQNVTDKDALELIGRIRECNVYDSKEKIIETFEEYIRRAKFIETFTTAGELFNQQKEDEAYKYGYAGFSEVTNFSLKRQMHSRIIADFDKRQAERQAQEYVSRKIPTGIPAFDYHSRGGIDRGTGLLGIGRSAVGKTTGLRSLGGNAMFRGINVLHIAAGDSTQKEVEDGYDSWWTGVDMFNIREGNIDSASAKRIEQSRKAYLAQCGEIYVHVFKGFNSASINDCRSILIDLLKDVDIGLVLFDYLEKFEPGDGKRYGTNEESSRNKKLATAEKIINIATEFDVAVATMTQASEVQKEIWNDPNKYLTRSNIANLKATIDPFSYCITLNQTEDESDNGIMRIHEEKMRHYPVNSWESTYPIVQKRDVGRFIDIAETKRRFWDEENKRIIRNIAKS